MSLRMKCLIVLFIHHFLSVPLYSGFFYNCPEDPPTEEILSICLRKVDLPSNFRFEYQGVERHPNCSGWLRKLPPRGRVDYAPGMSEGWKSGEIDCVFRYGYLQNPAEAKIAVLAALSCACSAEDTSISDPNPMSFSGKIFGDQTFSWDSEMENRWGKFVKLYGKPYPYFFCGLAFGKGNFACSIRISAPISQAAFCRREIEAFAEKVLVKIDIGDSLHGLREDMAQAFSLSEKPISLQASLDRFVKEYHSGNYPPAGVAIHSFEQELAPFRDKHLNETVFKTMTNRIEIIDQSLKQLSKNEKAEPRLF